MSKDISYDFRLGKLLIEAKQSATPAFSLSDMKSTQIDNEINLSRKQIENLGLRKDIQLKGKTLHILFCFLGGETFFIFLFSFCQATTFLGFHLEEWSFKLLTTVTILQITYMLQVAVKHLFPQKL